MGTPEKEVIQLQEDIDKVSNYDYLSDEERVNKITLADLKVTELERLKFLAAEAFRAIEGTDLRECEEYQRLDKNVRAVKKIRRKLIMSTKF